MKASSSASARETRFFIGIALAFSLMISSVCQADPSTPANQATALKVGKIPVSRVLFLGNSITLHGPKADIGWHGNWGMAASRQDRDYVHLLTAKIAKAAGGIPQIAIRNIADFERQFQTFDLNTGLQKELDLKPELVVVAIGENVPALTTEELKTGYARAFRDLLSALKKNGAKNIVVRSSFWADPAKDEIMKAASEEASAIFVSISEIGANPENAARSERNFEHAGVAAHPGDQGMQAIASALWNAIEQASK